MAVKRQLSSARALPAFAGRRVAVIGDAMLDVFLWGDATRISPEAPVPVVLLGRQSWSLGGAATGAANIASLGGRPLLFTACGKDQAAARLRRLAGEAGIELGWFAGLPARPTTAKYRVFASNKHMLRFDREAAEPIGAPSTASLLASLTARRDIEAVVVSDYAKGVVTPALVRSLARWCAAKRIPWCVDPKLTNIRYRGAAVVKPNRHELELLSGIPTSTLEGVRSAARRVLRRHGCRYVLVTRGHQGMALYGADDSEYIVAAAGQAVADVTGAGDTVSAVTGLGLAAGLPLPAIAEMANRAGAYVVSQPGIALVRPTDLKWD
ncbi:MAG: bifunctional heptose 7-phosphate kinase/heptose 1-phosphate adenyltransferase [Terriglobales bacterium]